MLQQLFVVRRWLTVLIERCASLPGFFKSNKSLSDSYTAYVVCEECVCVWVVIKRPGVILCPFLIKRTVTYQWQRTSSRPSDRKNGLSQGIYPPPPPTATPHPLTSHHTETVVANTTDFLITATTPSLVLHTDETGSKLRTEYVSWQRAANCVCWLSGEKYGRMFKNKFYQKCKIQ